MKNLRRLIMVSVCVIAALAASAQTVNRYARFDTTLHDFGTVDEGGGKVSHRFKVTNTGPEPLAFLYARSGCGCVRADIPKRPLKSGESGYVSVTFNPEGRPGKFSKEINVVSSGRQFNKLRIKGTVKASPKAGGIRYSHHIGHDIYADRSAMDFGSVKAGQTRKMVLKFTSDCAVTVNLDFRVADSGAGVSVTNGYILSPEGDGEVSVTVSPGQDTQGNVSTTIVPVANGYELTPIPVTYIAR